MSRDSVMIDNTLSPSPQPRKQAATDNINSFLKRLGSSNVDPVESIGHSKASSPGKMPTKLLRKESCEFSKGGKYGHSHNLSPDNMRPEKFTKKD